MLMAYGLLPVSEIRTLGWRNNHLPQNLEEVLRARSAERLLPIVDFLCDDVGTRSWRVVRALVREGTCPDRIAPPTRSRCSRRRGTRVPRRSSPTIRTSLTPRCGACSRSRAAARTASPTTRSSSATRGATSFVSLAARDPAMRERLLDVSLAALARDFSTYRAGWFSRFHESLAPTDEERAQRTDAYLGLLRSRVGPTVSMAVAALVRIRRRRATAAPTTCSAGSARSSATGLPGRRRQRWVWSAGPVPVRRTAGDGRPSWLPAALAHPSADVQRASIVLIGRLVDGPDDDVARAVADRVPEVAASQRSAAAGLAARLGGSDTAAHPGAAVVVDPAAAGGDAHVASRSCPRDRATDVARGTRRRRRLRHRIGRTGRRHRACRSMRSAGSAPTGRRGSTDSTGPLTKRARTILARRDSHPFSGYDPRSDVAARAARVGGRRSRGAQADPLVRRYRGRCVPVRACARGGRSGRGRPAVREPCRADACGRLDRSGGPRDAAPSGPPPSTLDLVAAILRLAPERS